MLLFLTTLACGDPQDRVYAPSQVPADDDFGYTLLGEDSVPDDLPDFRLEPISVPTWRFTDTGDLLDSSVYSEVTDDFTSDDTVAELEGGHFAHRVVLSDFTTERLAPLGAPA